MLACSAHAHADPAAATSTRAYGDLSFFYGGGPDIKPLARAALGIQVTVVGADASSSTRFRLGPTVDLTTLDPPGHQGGFGAEASADRMLSASIRIGLRGGVEWQYTAGDLWTIGPRLVLANTFWVGADLFELELAQSNPHGVLVGIGLSP